MDDEVEIARLAALAAPDWVEAFRAVPREHFIPDHAHATPMGDGEAHWIDRAESPSQWRAAVYDDTTLLTQIDDGATPLSPDASGLPTSSSTAPSLVAEFLRLLDPFPGDRVLEIGTGTGWTAGLLCARLGEERVTTIEVDERIAEDAAANLKRAGYAPHRVIGDGALGWPGGAPYDRVHVTCAVAAIPFAWIEQTRPGGVIALPWAPTQVWGHKVVLSVGAGWAVGRFHGDTAFMMLRSQRPDPPRPKGGVRESTGRVDPLRIAGADRGLEVVAAALLPGVVIQSLGTPDDRIGLWDAATGSYALSVRRAEGGSDVTEQGPRSLWTEMEDAYLRWVGMGEPGRDRLGLLVDRDGQHVWVDRPDNVIGAS